MYKAMSGDKISQLRQYKDELLDVANNGVNIKYSNADIAALIAIRYKMLYEEMQAKLKYEFPFGDDKKIQTK